MAGCPSGTKPSPVAERYRAFRNGPENLVVQHTGRYTGDKAATYLDAIRERLDDCKPMNGGAVRVAASGFAGDQSLLVVFNIGGAEARSLLVREGDVLTEVFAKPVRGDAALKELGSRAAARL